MVEAPGEAEATCAALCAAGLVKAVATSDGDALLYGAERVYQVIKLKARDPFAGYRAGLAVTTSGLPLHSARHPLHPI